MKTNKNNKMVYRVSPGFELDKLLNRLYPDPSSTDRHDAESLNLFIGTKSPDMTDRWNQSPKKTRYLSKLDYLKLMKGTPKLSSDISLKEKYLSEAESLSSQAIELHFKGMGNKSADDCYSLLVWFVWKTKYWKDPYWYTLMSTLQRKARGNAYQGKWRYISELLEIASSKTALWAYIKQNIPSKRYFNSLLSKGNKIAQTIQCRAVVTDPVKHKQFTRGFRDNHSGNPPSKEVATNQSDFFIKSEWSKNLVDRIPSEKESYLTYLYGFSRPVREIQVSETGIRYLQELDKEKERERIQREKQAYKEKHIHYLTAIAPSEPVSEFYFPTNLDYDSWCARIDKIKLNRKRN